MTKQKKLLLKELLKQYKQSLNQSSINVGDIVTVDLKKLRQIMSSEQGSVYLYSGIVNKTNVNSYMATVMTMLKRGGNKLQIDRISHGITYAYPNANPNLIFAIPQTALLKI